MKIVIGYNGLHFYFYQRNGNDLLLSSSFYLYCQVLLRIYNVIYCNSMIRILLVLTLNNFCFQYGLISKLYISKCSQTIFPSVLTLFNFRAIIIISNKNRKITSCRIIYFCCVCCF